MTTAESTTFDQATFDLIMDAASNLANATPDQQQAAWSAMCAVAAEVANRA